MKYLFCLALLFITLASSAQVGIGTLTPDPSAGLEVSSEGKGLLIPRVALTGTNDISTVAAPAISLLVYNTATAGAGISSIVPGFYYFDGTTWVALHTGSASGDMTKAVYDPANINEQLTGLTAIQTLTNKTLTSPVITTPTGLVKTDVGLGLVDNTSDLNKPISTATQSALNLKENAANKSTDGTLASNSDLKFPTEKATKTYVDSRVVAAGGWALGGNSGTTAGTHFVGTTDAQDLVFKVNSQKAGLINSASWNTSLGFTALNSGNGSGNTAIGTASQKLKNGAFGNTSIGSESLYSAGGSRNTAVGTSALYNNTAFDNVAVGYQALYTNNIGQFNTGIGFQALFSNTLGSGNTAVGNSALYKNIDGFENIAIGNDALYSNTSGSSNQAVGGYVLRNNTTGTDNNAFGYNTMNKNTSGKYNCAYGTGSLKENTIGLANVGYGLNTLSSNTSGQYNTAIGSNTLDQNSTGFNNTAVGSMSLRSVNSGSGNVALGYKAGNGYSGNDMLFIDNQERDLGNMVQEQTLLVGKFDADPVNQFVTINGFMIINNGTGTAGNASLAGATGYRLPTTRGNAGQVMKSNGDGTTSWGSAKSPMVTYRSSSVAGIDDCTILVDAANRNVTIALPSAIGNEGAKLVLKRIDTSGNAASVVTTDSQTIDGGPSLTLQAWQAVTLQSDGKSWFILGRN